MKVEKLFRIIIPFSLILVVVAPATSLESLLNDATGDFILVFDKSEAGGTEGTTDASIYRAGSQNSFNIGGFNFTTADRRDNSGNLGLGYLNGTNAGKPNKEFLNNGSLMAYWRMDATTDPLPGKYNVTDYSAYTKNGSNYGAERGNKGVFGTNSFEFNRSQTDYVQYDGSTTDNFQDGVTVSIWVNLNSTSANKQKVVSLDGGFTNSIPRIQAYSFGSYSVQWFESTDSYSVRGGNPETGAWHHMVFTHNNTHGKLFVDAEQIDTNNAPWGGLRTNKIRIGSEINNDAHPYGGKVDEFRLYNRSLAESEIKELYLNGVNGPFKGNYTSEKIDNSQETQWNKMEVNASIPPKTSLNASFRALDSRGITLDSEYIDLQDDSNPRNYSLTVSSSEDAEVFFNGTSKNVTKTWEVNEFAVYYEGNGGGETSSKTWSKFG